MPVHAFSFTVLAGALLLFLVEPFIGKVLLPWFGGGPGVWSTCLVFFQVVMLVGYGYAHLLVSRLSPARQVRVHLGVVAAALAVLVGQAVLWGAPVLPGAGLKPVDAGWPQLRVLGVLVVAVGLPFFVLSTTGPLVQAWFARVNPGASPYRLYALSNAGSLVALLAYPVLIEPYLTLSTQGWAWLAGFACFAGGLAVAGRLVRRGATPVGVDAPVEGPAVTPVRGRDFVGWAGLAAVPSLLLLSVTNQLSQEVAVSPFLWVVPLALYLVSFIVTFESSRWYSRRWAVGALALLLPLGFVVLATQAMSSLGRQLGVLLGLLFMASLFCHGELAARRPKVGHLTSFYLAVSLGGAVGAVSVPLLAPLVFSGMFELDASLLLVWGAVIAVLAGDATSAFHGRRALLARGLAGAWLVVLGLGAALRVAAWDRQALAVSRNFYGVLKVELVCGGLGGPTDCVRVEVNGATDHGLQGVAPGRRREPTGYYTRHSGIGWLLSHLPQRASGRPVRVGLVGLGVGTLAAYGEAGDLLRFYELNPAAIELARAGSPYFTFLSDTPATVELVEGDARLSLERELRQGGSQRFDVLVVDAFSSDSVPTHLLTREAFALYRAHLAGPSAVLALHVSNRHLDLAPVVWSQADAARLACTSVVTVAHPDDLWEDTATWMLLSETPGVLTAPSLAEDGREVRPRPVKRDSATWTDDFSNLWSVML